MIQFLFCNLVECSNQSQFGRITDVFNIGFYQVFGYIRVCDAYIADVSFRNPGTCSRRTDNDLTTASVLYLASLVIFAVEGLGRGDECVVAVCCLLICEPSVRNFQVVASFVYSFLSLTAPPRFRYISMASRYCLTFL